MRARAPSGKWEGAQNIGTVEYVCGHCGFKVSSRAGLRYKTGSNYEEFIYLCTHCAAPTLFSGNLDKQTPGPLPGRDVRNLPEKIEKAYAEARRSVKRGCPTAAVMMSRVLLWYVAEHQGLQRNPKNNRAPGFEDCMTYLLDSDLVPKRHKPFLDKLKEMGNEANHDLRIFTEEEAIKIVDFATYLLGTIYEAPELASTL